jgi:hypothetical protein
VFGCHQMPQFSETDDCIEGDGRNKLSIEEMHELLTMQGETAANDILTLLHEY